MLLLNSVGLALAPRWIGSKWCQNQTVELNSCHVSMKNKCGDFCSDLSSAILRWFKRINLCSEFFLSLLRTIVFIQAQVGSHGLLSSEEDGILKGLCVLGGIYFLFLTENLMGTLNQIRAKRVRSALDYNTPQGRKRPVLFIYICLIQVKQAKMSYMLRIPLEREKASLNYGHVILLPSTTRRPYPLAWLGWGSNLNMLFKKVLLFLDRNVRLGSNRSSRLLKWMRMTQRGHCIVSCELL